MKRLQIGSTSLVIAAALVLALQLAPANAVSVRQSSLSAGAPGQINYQGYLSDAGGAAYSGTADFDFAIYAQSSGGTALWQESRSGVAVGAGYFSVLLGSSTPLTAAIFDGPERYLEVTVNLGAGAITMPRQAMAAVPYAFQAAAAPWDGLSGVPAGFADGVDDAGVAYANVITVAASGGDYTSVAAALNSISDASESNRYLVWVAAGTYNESELVQVPAYVHLRGSGANASLITSARSASQPNDSAATARLDDNAMISDLTIRNSGTGTFSIAVWSADASRAATISDSALEANGSGGIGHYAVYLADAEPTISDSTLRASGAVGFGTSVNAALGIVNSAGGFPQPLIERSTLLGGNGDPGGKTCAGNSGTGFGIQYTNSAPQIIDSDICGDHRAIFAGTNGIARVVHSRISVSSTGSAFMIESTSAATITIANSGVFYVGNKHTGTGSMTCVHSYKANYTAASDGSNATAACN